MNEWHSHADVEPIRHAVVGEHDGGVAREAKCELRLDQIAFKRRRRPQTVGRRRLGGPGVQQSVWGM